MGGLKRRKPRGSAARRAGKIVTVVLVILIAYCCVYGLLARMIKGDSMPMPLGFGAGVVLTGSMEPTLSENTLIIVTRASHYSVGDVIVYQTGGTPVVHRIVELDEDSGLVTAQGDANNVPDEPITLSRVKGRVAFSIPGVGAVTRFIRTVPGLIMVLIAIITLFFLSMRTREKDRQEEIGTPDLESEIKELRDLIEKAAGSNKE